MIRDAFNAQSRNLPGTLRTVKTDRAAEAISTAIFAGMDADLDHDLISSITPDVMISLDRAGFFRKLDDVLCPADGSAALESCGGDFTLSKSILRAARFDPSNLKDIFAVLGELGGSCDCEILYNVAGSGRFKAKYWPRLA